MDHLFVFFSAYYLVFPLTTDSLTLCMVLHQDNRETDLSCQFSGEMQCRCGCKSVEYGGSHEASSSLDLIISDRPFISHWLCSQQPRHSSKDTAQTPQQPVRHSKYDGNVKSANTFEHLCCQETDSNKDIFDYHLQQHFDKNVYLGGKLL